MSVSAKDVRSQISLIQTRSARAGKSLGGYDDFGQVTRIFLIDVNLLQQKYGTFVGNAKAKHTDYVDQIEVMEGRINAYFEALGNSLARATKQEIPF